MKSNDTWRSVLRCAKIELNMMFCSPVAWLVLVVFTFQTGATYVGLLNDLIHKQAMGDDILGVTARIFGAEAPMGGTMVANFFTGITGYLYLYLPLITMGLLSREYSTGSVKLLFSAPIRTVSIVLGKFGAMVVYGGVLLLIVTCYILFSGCVIENFDWAQAWTGLLGVFLLICTYSAIGLFMSSLTAYPVVAGVGTMALLAVLNYIGQVGQGIAWVRGITYWLALSGKVDDFIVGIIPSESVIYFILLIIFFLAVTMMKLEDRRTRRSRKMAVLRYTVVFALLVTVAFISSRPVCKFYYDATRTQANTLSQESIDVINRLDGGLKITTYINVLHDLLPFNLPTQINEDNRRFRKFTRFKPEIELEHIYYWEEAENQYIKKKYPDLTNRELAELVCKVNKLDFQSVLTPEECREMIDLSGEGYRPVRLLERENGQKLFLREYNDHTIYPKEPEITGALKSMMDGTIGVTFVEGHGDRTIASFEKRGYAWASIVTVDREAMINNGFTPVSVDLRQEDIPDRTGILIISSLQTPLTDGELQKVKTYVESGGNLLILAEFGRQQNMAFTQEMLGIRFSDEVAVCPVKDQDPTIVWGYFTKQAATLFPKFTEAYNRKQGIIRKSLMDIDYSGVKGFRVTPLYGPEPGKVWLEKETVDLVRDTVVFNPYAGEEKRDYTFALTLDRKIDGKEQRIAVFSDPMLFTTETYNLVKDARSAGYILRPAIMRWLSGDEYPILAEKEQPTDNRIYLKNSTRTWNKILLAGILPLLFLVIGLIVIRKRKRG